MSWLRFATSALLVVGVAGCQVLPAASDRPQPASPEATDASTPASSSQSPSATGTATPTPTLDAVPSATSSSDIEFVRWATDTVVLAPEPGGEISASQDEHAKLISAVLDRVELDGTEWIHVQFGSERPGDFVQYGWAPAEADVERGGEVLHLDPVYEYVVPGCPRSDLELSDLSGMVALLRVHCFGSSTLTFKPVQVRSDTSAGEPVAGTPEWLAGSGLYAMHWMPEGEPVGAIWVYVDPASDVDLPLDTWLEVTGTFDHPAARDCQRSSDFPWFNLPNDLAVALCRGRFVVSEIRRLDQAEIPQTPPAPVEPGPNPDREVQVSVRPFDAPIQPRHSVAHAWTGAELLVWGGSNLDLFDDKNFADGAAYDPIAESWREIASGPLSARTAAAATWTGSEMLVWGGYSDRYFYDGAAYDPVADAWRPISPPPFEPVAPEHDATWSGVWAETGWWLCQFDDTGLTTCALYEPATDTWQPLPPLQASSQGGAIVWTGDELLILNEWVAITSIRPDGGSWTSHPVAEFGAPMIWTGELVIGWRYADIDNDPFASEDFNYPVAWDPRARAEVALPLPPESVFGPRWIDNRLVYMDDMLALDLELTEWQRLHFDAPRGLALDRAGAATAWTGDQYIAWGGTDGCGGGPGYEQGYEVTFHWQPATVRSAVAGSDDLLAPSPQPKLGSPGDATVRSLLAC